MAIWRQAMSQKLRVVQLLEVEFQFLFLLPYKINFCLKENFTKLNLWKVYNPANSLSSHEHSVTQNSGLYSVWKNFQFLFLLPYELKFCLKENFTKLNLWKVYNPDFLAHSLSSHEHSVTQNSGLYSLCKNFLIFFL